MNLLQQLGFISDHLVTNIDSEFDGAAPFNHAAEFNNPAERILWRFAYPGVTDPEGTFFKKVDVEIDSAEKLSYYVDIGAVKIVDRSDSNGLSILSEINGAAKTTIPIYVLSFLDLNMFQFSILPYFLAFFLECMIMKYRARRYNESSEAVNSGSNSSSDSSDTLQLAKLHAPSFEASLINLGQGMLMLLSGTLLFCNWSTGAYNHLYTNYRFTDVFAGLDVVGLPSWMPMDGDPYFNSKLYEFTAFWGCLIMVDFFYYWWHRSSHQLSWMWTVHQIHHSTEEYNLSVTLREPLRILENLVPIQWLIMLASIAFFFPFGYMSIVATNNLLYMNWLHTCVIGKTSGWKLEWLMMTPSLHRVHHGRSLRCLGKNYSCMFVLWDRIFGTYEPEDFWMEEQLMEERRGDSTNTTAVSDQVVRVQNSNTAYQPPPLANITAVEIDPDNKIALPIGSEENSKCPSKETIVLAAENCTTTEKVPTKRKFFHRHTKKHIDDEVPLRFGVIPQLWTYDPVWINLNHWHHMFVGQVKWTPVWKWVCIPFAKWTPQQQQSSLTQPILEQKQTSTSIKGKCPPLSNKTNSMNSMEKCAWNLKALNSWWKWYTLTQFVQTFVLGVMFVGLSNSVGETVGKKTFFLWKSFQRGENGDSVTSDVSLPSKIDTDHDYSSIHAIKVPAQTLAEINSNFLFEKLPTRFLHGVGRMSAYNQYQYYRSDPAIETVGNHYSTNFVETVPESNLKSWIWYCTGIVACYMFFHAMWNMYNIGRCLSGYTDFIANSEAGETSPHSISMKNENAAAAPEQTPEVEDQNNTDTNKSIQTQLKSYQYKLIKAELFRQIGLVIAFISWTDFFLNQEDTDIDLYKHHTNLKQLSTWDSLLNFVTSFKPSYETVILTLTYAVVNLVLLVGMGVVVWYDVSSSEAEIVSGGKVKNNVLSEPAGRSSIHSTNTDSTKAPMSDLQVSLLENQKSHEKAEITVQGENNDETTEGTIMRLRKDPRTNREWRGWY